MKTRKEIEAQLRILTQAYYFTSAHLGELSEEARVKHRSLEECIRLLQWCLEDPASQGRTWQAAGEAFARAFHLLGQALFGRF